MKISCLRACENNIEKATELYNYMAADLQNLPDIDPIAPSALEKIMHGADDIFGWVGQHQEDIVQGISVIKGLKTRVTPEFPGPIPTE